jgi:hypothetical protein
LNFLQIFGKTVKESQIYEEKRWGTFILELEKHHFWTSSAEIAIFVDFSVNPRSLFLLLTLRKHRKVLVRVEPQSVNPGQFTRFVSRLFDFCIDEASVTKGRANFTWNAGFDFPSDELIGEMVRPYQVGALMGRKVSFFKLSQYHIRAKILNSLSIADISVCFAGRGWSENPLFLAKAVLRAFVVNASFGLPFLSPQKVLQAVRAPRVDYLGEFSLPQQFYKGVGVALVVENEHNALSEKIFDAVAAGCSVIYLGRPIPISPNILQINQDFDTSEIVNFVLANCHVGPVDLARSREVLEELNPSADESFKMLADLIMKKVNTDG